MKPTIGIMPLYDNERKSIWMLPGYLELVEKNGGIPLILPLTIDKETLASFFYYLRRLSFYRWAGYRPKSLWREKTSCLWRTIFSS